MINVVTILFALFLSSTQNTDAYSSYLSRRKDFRVEGQREQKSSCITYSAIIASVSCQLLGMNAATPTDFNFSFKGFSLRGGTTDIHKDGWGIAFYEGRGMRAFHDSEACSSSPIANLVSSYPMRTHNMLAHIRYATQGKRSLENVHPFHREMWGIQWCFAHNGDAPLFKDLQEDVPWIGKIKGERVYNPVGDTDSERIFCSLLNALKAKFKANLPSLPVLYEYLGILLDEIVSFNKESTILNMILGCGQYTQFCYSYPGARPGSNVWNALHYVIREPPFRRATLTDCNYAVDFASLNGENDRVAIIATKPLTTNEDWIEFGIGELILFDEGIPHRAPKECFSSEMMGHGLSSNVIPSKPSLEEDMRRFHYEKKIFSGLNI